VKDDDDQNRNRAYIKLAYSSNSVERYQRPQGAALQGSGGSCWVHWGHSSVLVVIDELDFGNGRVSLHRMQRRIIEFKEKRKR